MKIKIAVVLPYCLGVMLAGINRQVAVNFGSSLQDGVLREDQRYRAHLAEIGKEDVDALAQYNNQVVFYQSVDAKFQSDALTRYNDRRRQISNERVDIEGTHNKNVIAILIEYSNVGGR